MARVATGRNRRLRRLVNLAAFLSGKSDVPLRTVCDLFGISRAELVSLLNEMLMCGVPPYGPCDYISAWIEGDRVRVSNADWLRKPVQLSTQEAVSLKLVIREFFRDSPDVLKAAARSLEEKAQAFLGNVSKPQPPGPSRGKRYEVLRRGMEEKRAVKITYYSRTWDEITERLVDPFKFVNVSGLWCIDAYCRYSHKEVLFALERISNATLTDDEFQRRWKPVKYWSARAFFDEFPRSRHASRIRVRFDPVRARWAAEQFSDAVERELPDGTLICVFKAVDPYWIAEIIAEFAGSATVEGPELFRGRFHELLGAVEALYRGNGTR